MKREVIKILNYKVLFVDYSKVDDLIYYLNTDCIRSVKFWVKIDKNWYILGYLGCMVILVMIYSFLSDNL